MKINFDTSVLQDGAASWDFIIRDEQGKIIHCGAELGKDISPVLAEARALRLALSEALKRNFHDVLIDRGRLLDDNKCCLRRLRMSMGD